VNPNSSSPPPPSISAVAAASLPRSYPRAAPGGELRTRVARRRPRAPRRLGAVAGVPVLRRRVDPPLRRDPAAVVVPASFACLRASRRCIQRLESWPETQDQVRRRVPPPLTAGRRRRPTHHRPRRRSAPVHILCRWIKIQRPKSNPPPSLEPAAVVAVGSRSDGSDQPDPGSIPVHLA
jgi:hypothetical protein